MIGTLHAFTVSADLAVQTGEEGMWNFKTVSLKSFLIFAEWLSRYG
jgi:hypothetical protein